MDLQKATGTLAWGFLLSAVLMGGCSNAHRATLANPGLDQQPMRGVFYFRATGRGLRPPRARRPNSTVAIHGWAATN